MSMFCYQCQEAINGGCSVAGACGKKADTANLQDQLIYALKGIAVVARASGAPVAPKVGLFIASGLFTTITNANFDNSRFEALIPEALRIRDMIAAEHGVATKELHESASWAPKTVAEFANHPEAGVLAEGNEDVRSLRELLIYGLKGVAAYLHHAAQLGHESANVNSFLVKALASTTDALTVDQMVGMVLECGEKAVETLALLDAANTSAYGKPEITEVNIGVGTRPGILISGHDLKDMEMLLKQSEGKGVDIYTHSEMLPANYYPAFKKYDHFHGNYGGAWYDQNKEFDSFNGPILLTTNCITPVKESYRDRFFTTGEAGYPGTVHITAGSDGTKDFSRIIELALTCDPPREIETGSIVGGFAHDQVLALADKVVDAVKQGAIKRFVVMAGCDGRHKERAYFSDVAEALPDDAVILTAGCAKYRYNKLNLGDIGGIPRVLDAGQCNDSYSLAVIALKLKEVFGLDDINELPISYDIAWYEQKAVAVLLALLHLGVKNIRLGPSLPSFLSPNVAKVLVENFNIMPTGEVQADVAKIMAGR